jgi:hypothetical protein
MFGFIIAAVLSGAGYIKSRAFVENRLRYVDAVQTPIAPVIVGTVAALAVAPIVWVLPVVGAGTAVLFGIGIGAGTRAGLRRIRSEATVPQLY